MRKITNSRVLTVLAYNLLHRLNNQENVSGEGNPYRSHTRPTKKRVDKIGNILIEIYPNDHPPAHFHVTCPQYKAKYTIEDGQLLAVITGKLLKSDSHKITAWAIAHRELLIQIWQETRPTVARANVGLNLPRAIHTRIHSPYHGKYLSKSSSRRLR